MLARWDSLFEPSRFHDHLARAALDVEPASRVLRPRVDIREEDDAFVLHVALPGVKLADIQVEVERGVLAIRGERKFTSDEAVRKTYRRVEHHFGAFSRSFSLPDNVDTDAITASLDAGILDVRIPKRASTASRKITINSPS